MLLFILIIIICIFVVFYPKKVEKMDNEIKKIKTIKQETPYEREQGEFFMKEQFHEDYRDTMNSFDLIRDKELVYDGTIGDFAKTFISIVNNNLNEQGIGWQSVLPDPHIESGWDKQMKYLGLPVSLYEEDLKKKPIRIVQMGDIFMRDDMYILRMIIRKKGVSDKLIIKLELKQISENKIKIVNIFVEGFLTKILKEY